MAGLPPLLLWRRPKPRPRPRPGPSAKPMGLDMRQTNHRGSRSWHRKRPHPRTPAPPAPPALPALWRWRPRPAAPGGVGEARPPALRRVASRWRSAWAYRSWRCPSALPSSASRRLTSLPSPQGAPLPTSWATLPLQPKKQCCRHSQEQSASRLHHRGPAVLPKATSPRRRRSLPSVRGLSPPQRWWHRPKKQRSHQAPAPPGAVAPPPWRKTCRLRAVWAKRA
mmetsp:Transcript_56009/g.120553  ORF Transcript_56009/g.120553 Transcript_56009/m.120553 type:complete len:224 (+) Transcript_56009:1543-2214(+)